MKQYLAKIGIILLVVGLSFASSDVNASTILGFTTSPEDGSSFEITDAGGSLKTLDFGSLSVTEAKIGTLSISELIDADVIMSDVTIDLSTENLEATFGGSSLYSYSISSGTISDGFQLKVGADVVLEADLTLELMYAYGKSGIIDPGMTVNLTNVEVFTTGLNSNTVAFLGNFLNGADLVLSLATDNINMYDGLNGTDPFTGVGGGTATPNAVPEPISYFIMGWGAVVLYALRKVSYWFKY